MIIEARQVNNIWQSRPPPRNNVITDASYETVNTQLLNERIFPLYWRWLSSMKLTRWAHKWDCDNFSEAFRTFACGYYYSTIESSAEGIAIGIIHYFANSRQENGTQGPHAINVAINCENNNISPIFIEPQACKIINLTPEEFNSIWLLYI